MKDMCTELKWPKIFLFVLQNNCNQIYLTLKLFTDNHSNSN